MFPLDNIFRSNAYLRICHVKAQFLDFMMCNLFVGREIGITTNQRPSK